MSEEQIGSLVRLHLFDSVVGSDKMYLFFLTNHVITIAAKMIKAIQRFITNINTVYGFI